MESPRGNKFKFANPAMRDKCVNEFAFYQKANSNLLNIDAKQAIGINPRMELIYENIKHIEF
jgi:hypothetical protein